MPFQASHREPASGAVPTLRSAVGATQKEWIKRLEREGWTRERGGSHQWRIRELHAQRFGSVNLP